MQSMFSIALNKRLLKCNWREYMHYAYVSFSMYAAGNQYSARALKYLQFLKDCFISKCIKYYKLQKRSHYRGVPRIWEGGGQEFFFFRFGNLHVAKRHAAHGEAMRIARGVRGHAPPRKFFKTVQFGAF